MKRFLIAFFAFCICIGNIVVAKSKNSSESYALKRGIEAYENDEYADALDWLNKEVEENPKKC
ncbi:MAG: hypothetical protein J1E63_01080 [Muribaculaceae bacterium]|nr:hypothetical protein [Muribaculaceae bacterium]